MYYPDSKQNHKIINISLEDEIKNNHNKNNNLSIDRMLETQKD